MNFSLVASLTFSEPAWPGLLDCAAFILLLLEGAMLFGHIFRKKYGEPVWGLLGVPLVSPVLGPIIWMRVLLVGATPRSWRLARLTARACAWLGLIAVAIWLPLGTLWVLPVCGAFWVIRSYRRTTQRLSRRKKRLLLALRIAVLFAAAFWVAGPVWQEQARHVYRSKVLLAVDASSSMLRRDVPEENDSSRRLARNQAVMEILRRSETDLRSLTDDADIEVLVFSDRPEAQMSLEPSMQEWRTLFSRLESSSGEATALGDSLSAATEAVLASGKPLAAILLISDGSNNTSSTVSPDQFASLMAVRGTPMFIAGVGSDSVSPNARGLTLNNLISPDEVEIYHRLTATVDLEALGLAGREVRVTARLGENEIGSQTIAISEARHRERITFSCIPGESGFFRWVIQADLPGEALELSGNLREEKLIQVTDRETGILYLEEVLRPESKYLAQALTGDPYLRLDRRILPRPYEASRGNGLSENLEDWLGYDVILLGDISADRFSRRQLELIRELVDTYGKGVGMIGGEAAFGAGGWADTPLAEVMGIDLNLSRGQLEQEITVHSTDAGREAKILPWEEETASVKVSPRSLPGANRLEGIKPAAAVLAVSQDNHPLIVAQPYGKGRSLAVAFDTTWRWVLSPEDTAEWQKRFWRQVVLNLAAPKGSAWIVTDQPRYDLNRLRNHTGQIQVTAAMVDDKGQPILREGLNVTLTHPDGRETPLPLARDGMEYRGTLATVERPGVYRLTMDSEQSSSKTEYRFEVQQRDLEAADVLANLDLLRRMAAATQGRFVELEAFSGLLREVQLRCRPEMRLTHTRENLSDRLHWPIWVVLVVLLATEWILRKRWGLI